MDIDVLRDTLLEMERRMIKDPKSFPIKDGSRCFGEIPYPWILTTLAKIGRQRPKRPKKAKNG